MPNYLKIKCDNYLNSRNLILFSIKTNYPELDFSYYLFDGSIVSKSIYRDFLYDSKNFIDRYNKLKKKYSNEWDMFNNILKYHKGKYRKAKKNVNIGRVGESLNKTIFGKATKKSIILYKRMTSNIFESGIDFIYIKYNRNLKNFEYFFFEVKATQNNYKSCEFKINSWYTLHNFTTKYLFELESIKEKVFNSINLSDKEKSLIRNDLRLLAQNLINKIKPSNQFFFCSSVYCEFFNGKLVNIERDILLNKGYNYIFIINDFYKIIREVYKCLEITI